MKNSKKCKLRKERIFQSKPLVETEVDTSYCLKTIRTSKVDNHLATLSLSLPQRRFLFINIDEIMSEMEHLSEEEIQDMVNYLLEKLNDISEDINQLSIKKEEMEASAKSITTTIAKEMKDISEKHSGKCIEIEQIIERYFILMYQLCRRQLLLKQYQVIISDAQDELTMARLLVTEFDFAYSSLQFKVISQLKKNIDDRSTKSMFQRKTSAVMKRILLAKVKGTTIQVDSGNVLGEMTEGIRKKIPTLCRRLVHLEQLAIDEYSNYEEDRLRFDHFCDHYDDVLKVILPLLVNHFDNRMSLLIFEDNIRRLEKKVTDKRAEHCETMADLQRVCTYIYRQDVANGKKTWEEVGRS